MIMNADLVMQAIRDLAVPLANEDSINKLIKKAGDAQYVLLGEASHGTSEFYSVRAELSKRLITEEGFRFIAVEGDWPSCYELNRYVKGYMDAGTSIKEVLSGNFRRWPSWMWANEEISELAKWLRSYNADKPEEEKVGFYGIDVYSLWESMNEIINYLQEKGGDGLEAARRAFACFEPYSEDEQSYAVSASIYGGGCEDDVVALLSRLQDRWKDTHKDDQENALSAELNAMAVKGAEAYYRTMVRHDAESWNVRDRHMAEALEKLVEFHGEGARAIVWEHNTHIGDARATDMAEEGMVNVGQLLREKHGHKHVFAIGFGTYEGSVIAGRAWGEPLEEMAVPPAVTNSWEELLHRVGPENKILMFGKEEPALDETVVGHRAIGVVYHPHWERGNYVPTVISKRYDAFIYIDHTKALSPIAAEPMNFVYDYYKSFIKS